MIAIIAIPAGAGIAATANWFVPLLLGAKWTEAIPLVAVLAFYGILTAMKTNAFYIYFALGKSKIATYLTIVQTTLLLPTLIVLTMRFGGIGAVYGYLMAQAVFTPISFSVLFKVLGVSVRQVTLVLWRPLVAAVFMFAIVWILEVMLPPAPQATLKVLEYFILAAICGVVSYATCLYALWLLSKRPVGAESCILDEIHSTGVWLRLKSYQV